MAAVLPDCPYVGFTLPAFREYKYCCICIRYEVTKQWLMGNKVSEVLNPWVTEDYDVDACIVPLTMDMDTNMPFCGVVGQFPMYRTLGFYYDSANTIKQRGVRKRRDHSLPRFYQVDGMQKVYDVSFCVLLCGLFRPYEKFKGVIDQMHRVLNNKKKDRIEDPWLDHVECASCLGVYPHCVPGQRAKSFNFVYAVREYIVFVVETDVLLRTLCRSLHSDWDYFARETVRICNNIRAGLPEESVKFRFLVPKHAEVYNRNVRPGPVAYPKNTHEFKQQVDSGFLCAELHKRMHIDADEFEYRQIKLRTNLPSKQYYICKKCDKFKGPRPVTIRKKDGSIEHSASHQLGNVQMQFDVYTGLHRCFKKKTGGRSKEIKQMEAAKLANEKKEIIHVKTCHEVCNLVTVKSHYFHIGDVCYGACEQCDVVFPVNGVSVVFGHLCIMCRNGLQPTVLQCDACGKYSKKDTSKWMKIPCIAANFTTQFVHLCKKDSKMPFLRQASATGTKWAYDYLMESIGKYKINNKTKRRAKQTQRN